jgi:uncharacterized protein
MELYRRAADAGDTTAIEILRRCYEYGTGVAEGKDLAVEIHRRAADAGNAAALGDLARLHVTDIGIPVEKAKEVGS